MLLGSPAKGREGGDGKLKPGIFSDMETVNQRAL